MGRIVTVSERALLGRIVARRRPDLLDAVEAWGRRPLSPFRLDELRALVVDELCERPAVDHHEIRAIIEIEELLARI